MNKKDNFYTTEFKTCLDIVRRNFLETLGEATLKVYEVILKETYGSERPFAYIKLPKFKELTGINAWVVKDKIQILKEKRLINVIQDNTKLKFSVNRPYKIVFYE